MTGIYALAESQDARIAQYTFGKSIAQFGVSVFSCNNARKGKVHMTDANEMCKK